MVNLTASNWYKFNNLESTIPNIKHCTFLHILSYNDTKRSIITAPPHAVVMDSSQESTACNLSRRIVAMLSKEKASKLIQ